MRRALAILLVLVGALMMAGAVSAGDNIEVGFKAGTSLGYIFGSYGSKESPEFAVTAGLFATVRLGDVVSFQPELLWARRAASYERIGGASSATVTFDCIDVPLLLRFSSRTHSSSGPAFVIGPLFAINTAATVEGEFLRYSYVGFGEYYEIQGKADIANIHRVNVGLALGVSFDHQVSERSRTIFDLRFVVPLHRYTSNEATSRVPGTIALMDHGEGAPLKPGSISLMLGFVF